MSDDPKRINWVWLSVFVAISVWSLLHLIANNAEKQKEQTMHIHSETFSPERSPSHYQAQQPKAPVKEKPLVTHDSLRSTITRAMTESQNDRLDKMTEADLKQRMSEATFDELAELVVAMDTLPASSLLRDKMEILIYQQMAAKNVSAALDVALTRIYNASREVRESVYYIFRDWAWKGHQNAETWLDRQIADGLLESRSSDGLNRPRNGLESKMWDAMVGSGDFEGLARRIGNLSENTRHLIIPLLNQSPSPDREVAFIDIMRRYFDEKSVAEREKAVVWNRVMYSGYNQATQTIERLAISPTQIEDVIGGTVTPKIYSLSTEGPLKQEDFEDARAWVRQHTPNILGTLTGDMLVLIAQTRRAGKYEESMKLLNSLEHDPERDVTTAYFIRHLNLDSLKVKSLPLIDTIQDPVLRKQSQDIIDRAIERK